MTFIKLKLKVANNFLNFLFLFQDATLENKTLKRVVVKQEKELLK